MVFIFSNTLFCRVAWLIQFEVKWAIIFIFEGPKSNLYLKAVNVQEQVLYIYSMQSYVLSIQRKEKIKTNYCVSHHLEQPE